MLIECSACRAVFSLQEGAAPPGSRFRVECGRCHAVFEVAAPAKGLPAAQDAGALPAGPALDDLALPPEDPGPPIAEAGKEPGSVSDPLAAVPRTGLALAPAPVPEEPVPLGAPVAARRLSRRGKLIVGGAIAAVAGIGAALLLRGGAADVDALVRRGRELLLRDDRRSLEEATKLFTDAARAAPGQAVPEAERAFALLLQAAAARDLARRVPPGERERQERDAARLLQQGAAAAREALANEKEAPSALRASALAAAIEGKAEEALAYIARAEVAEPGDAWVLYVKGAAAAAAQKQDLAVQALSAARQAEPALLRVDVDLAAIALDGGDAKGARSLLDEVLRRNSRHERARRMLSSIGP